MDNVYYHCGQHQPDDKISYDISVDNEDDLKRIIFNNYKTTVYPCECVSWSILNLQDNVTTFVHIYQEPCEFRKPPKRRYYNIMNNKYLQERKFFFVGPKSNDANQSELLIFELTNLRRTTWELPRWIDTSAQMPLLSEEQFLNNIIDGSVIVFKYGWYKPDPNLYYSNLISSIVQLLSNTNFRLVIKDYGERGYTEYFIRESLKTKRALKDSEKTNQALTY